MPSMMPTPRGHAPLLIALSMVTVVACSSNQAPCEQGPFGGGTCTVGGEITTGDAVLFVDEQLVYAAQAIYGFGPGLPNAVLWTTSDPTVVEVETLPNNTASVTALDTGTAWVRALINAEFSDSVLITVVVPGATRWQSTFSGVPVGRYPAIGSDSVVRVATGGASPLLWLFRPDSGTSTSVASCFSALGPSIGGSDVAVTTAANCTRKHLAAGDNAWTAPVGSADLGVAIATDGSVITLSGDSVYRVSATGTVMWSQDLRGVPVTAPVIGPGGDIYVGWSAGNADSVSRFGIDSTPRWSVAVPGLSPGTPAVTSAGRLVFGRPGGMFALDSSGTVRWDGSFPGASATSQTSSPVHDGLVAYIQNEDGLYSYALDGTFLWAADSLGYGASTGTVGAPVLLGDLSLVVPCAAPAGGRDVCAVRQGDGRLSWRSPPGTASADGLAVGKDGIIFATQTLAGGSSALAALWARISPMTTGWPAEGGNQQHTRR